MRGVRKKLTVALSQAFGGKRDGDLPGIVMPGNELLDLPAILFAENGARRIQQFTTTAEQLPKRVENLRLPLRHGGDIGGFAQPFDVGVAAHHARSGARYVGKNAVE